MKIICKYNKELEKFLKKVVRYTLKKYGEGLNLERLETIELKEIVQNVLDTDGRTCDNGTSIVVVYKLSC